MPAVERDGAQQFVKADDVSSLIRQMKGGKGWPT
jgi:hypothetical protein